VLYRSLTRGSELFNRGARNAARLIAAARKEFAAESSVRLDYFEIVNPENLDAVEDVSRGALVAVAAYVDTTRLIDNILLVPR